MNRDVAQFVIASAARSAHELASLVPFLKEHGDGEADQALVRAIASAIYEVGSVRELAFQLYPELKTEYEARLKKFGRPVY